MSYLCQSHANEKKQSCFPLGITGRRLVPLHTWLTADMPTHKALEKAEKEEEEEEGGEGRVGAGPNGRGAHRPNDHGGGPRGEEESIIKV